MVSSPPLLWVYGENGLLMHMVMSHVLLYMILYLGNLLSM